MALLWTDYCFLSLLVLCFFFILANMRKPHVRLIGRRLFKQPLAVSSGIILLFFLMIGVLDSIHLKANNGAITDTLSLLDKIMAPVGQMYEKTYSAPLALRLYSTEIILINEESKQDYPRLKYPPNRIQTEADKWARIREIIFSTFIVSFMLVSLGVLCRFGINYFFRPRKSIFTKGMVAGIGTVFIGLFITLVSYRLSRDFHLFGTGKIGQDIFYYTVKSIRTGLIIGTLTTLFMLPLAIILGVSAGYFGGIIDDIIQYVYTTLSSIPGVLLITASVLSMQTYIANHPQQFSTLEKSADARLFALCLILGVTSWTSLCRLLRAEALKLREMDFILAAIALNSSVFRIFYKHLLPNVMSIILITLVLDFSFLVLAEAVLSYVGVGVSPMTISWGNMINGARLELAREPIVWWPIMAAFIYMFILVLASNIFADAIRDALDPRYTNAE